MAFSFWKNLPFLTPPAKGFSLIGHEYEKASNGAKRPLKAL
jgi:hypothetical protein